MCGRYAQTLPPEAARRIFRTANPLPNHPPSWNVAPTMQAMVVRRDAEGGERRLELMRWGLVPYWAKDISIGSKSFNARSEGAADKPMFREALRRGRRCIVPADAFYEWQKTATGKVPHAIGRADGEPLALAGLWERWKQPEGGMLHSFTIMTTTPNPLMAALHDRMPVILAPEDWDLWLGEREGDSPSLMRPCPAEWLKVWKVSPRVGSVKNDDQSLLEPLPQAAP